MQKSGETMKYLEDKKRYDNPSHDKKSEDTVEKALTGKGGWGPPSAGDN